MSQKYYILADNQAITRAGLNFIIRELHLSERIIHIYSKQELPDLLKKNSQAIIISRLYTFRFFKNRGVDKLTRTISLLSDGSYSRKNLLPNLSATFILTRHSASYSKIPHFKKFLMP